MNAERNFKFEDKKEHFDAVKQRRQELEKKFINKMKEEAKKIE